MAILRRRRRRASSQELSGSGEGGSGLADTSTADAATDSSAVAKAAAELPQVEAFAEIKKDKGVLAEPGSKSAVLPPPDSISPVATATSPIGTVQGTAKSAVTDDRGVTISMPPAPAEDETRALGASDQAISAASVGSTTVPVPEEDPDSDADLCMPFGFLPIEIHAEGPTGVGSRADAAEPVARPAAVDRGDDGSEVERGELVELPSDTAVSSFLQESLGSLEAEEVSLPDTASLEAVEVEWRDEPEHWEGDDHTWKEITAEWARESLESSSEEAVGADEPDEPEGQEFERADVQVPTAAEALHHLAPNAASAGEGESEAPPVAGKDPVDECVEPVHGAVSDEKHSPQVLEREAVDVGEEYAPDKSSHELSSEAPVSLTASTIGGSTKAVVDAMDSLRADPFGETEMDSEAAPVPAGKPIGRSPGEIPYVEASYESPEEAGSEETGDPVGGEAPSGEGPGRSGGEVGSGAESAPSHGEPETPPSFSQTAVEAEEPAPEAPEPAVQAPEPALESKGRSLPVAVAVGVLVAGAALGLMILGPGYFAWLVVVVCMLGIAELVTAARKCGFQPAALVMLAGAAVTMLATAKQGTVGLGFGFTLVVACSTLWFVAEVIRISPVANLAATVFGFAYVAIPASLALSIIGFPRGSDLWRAHVSFLVLVSVAVDVGGYLVGRKFGKRFVVRSISPNKSLEGYVGSVLLATVVTAGIVLGGRFAEATSFSFWTPARAFVGMLVVVAASVLGDLSESLLKRSLGVKDMSAVLPGHGGVLDRFDSLLTAVPVFWIFLQLAK